MAEKTRAEFFEENRPTLAEADIQKALTADKVVVSFDALPVPLDSGDIGLLCVKFALPDGTSSTLLLDQFAADLLHGVIAHLQQTRWQTTQTLPPGTKPN